MYLYYRKIIRRVLKIIGARTVEEVRKATGAGTGACKGNRCTYTIEKLL
ncbi:(2Fe-2S)-binding protein, partial [Clostridium botulinum]